MIGAGAALAEDLTDAAENHPDIDFALIDADFTRDGLSNAKPLLFTVAEAAYLAGYTAAGTTTTGAVGTYGGRATPAVQGFMEGFAQGVARYNADRGGRASATGGADGGTGVELLGWDPADPENGSFVGDFSDVAGSRRSSSPREPASSCRWPGTPVGARSPRSPPPAATAASCGWTPMATSTPTPAST